MLPNTASLVLSMFATWRLGAALTPLNPALVVGEVTFQVADAAAKVLMVEEPAGLSGLEVPGVSLLPARELIEHRVTHDIVAPPSEDALALLIYTSGTTGRPKGVMLDHANLNAMCQMAIDILAMTPADNSLLILPLFHVNGIIVGTLSPLLAGGRTTIAGRFSPKTFFDRVEQTGATYFSAVPTIYMMLADLPPERRRIPPRCGSPYAVRPRPVSSCWRSSKLVMAYRLSRATDCPKAPARARSTPSMVGVSPAVGVPLPGQRIRIIDADGSQVPDGTAGEVAIRGPNVMRGYLNRPEETAKTLVDGWLHTGDIGFLDDDGYLFLVDRAKDMIIRGGEHIYPKEIESVVYHLPEIAEAAVVGRAHPVYGEEPVLFVALNSGATLGTDQIGEHLLAVLAKYKLPVEITVLDDLPKNAVGKIDKPSLRKRLESARRSGMGARTPA